MKAVAGACRFETGHEEVTDPHGLGREESCDMKDLEQLVCGLVNCSVSGPN